MLRLMSALGKFVVAQLDPFHYPIPRKLASDPELGPWVIYLHKYLHQSWLKLGGSDDSISETTARDAYDSTMHAAAVQELHSRIDENERSSIYEQVSYATPLKTKVISNQTYISPGRELIKAKQGSTIKLHSNPSSDYYIYAHNGDGTLLEIDGNGRKINGHTKMYIRSKGNGVQIYYFIEDNEFIAI